jgi:hypothetical protein
LEPITDPFELQARLIYSVIVAGKSAKFANAVIDRWISENCLQNELPFDTIKRLDKEQKLEESFRLARSGNYSKLVAATSEIAKSNIDLLTCEPAELEKIKGFGPKTSRFFILWTRPDAQFAALDVHVLRWLRNQGHNAPESTPQSSKQYAELESIFLKEAEKQGKTARQLDLEIWQKGSTSTNVIGKMSYD